MIKTVLFDMDGLLLDSERPAQECSRRALHEMGYELPDAIAEKTPGATMEYIDRLMKDHFGPDFDTNALRQRSHTLWHEYLAENGMQTMPGAEATLRWLKENGFATCVASSTLLYRVKECLEQAGIAQYFDGMVGGDMAARSKPAPDIFLLAAQTMGVPAEQCVAVEDSYNGVRSASSAGCITVMIPDLLPATDEMRNLTAAILPSLHELPAFIQTLL